MEYILQVIKEQIDYIKFDPSISKWIFLKSHDWEIKNYGDLDIFVIVKTRSSIFSTAEQVSTLAAQLTISLNLYVTIFPIFERDLYEAKTQFLKNLQSKGLEL